MGLRGADLGNACLRGAQLVSTDGNEAVFLEDAGLRGADLRGADLRAGLKPQVLGGIEAREREREDLLSRMIPAMENLEYDAGVPKTVDG